jgi:AcrR family transcriptional regulator
MENLMTTQDKLLLNARRLFWSRGYSNVSVRQIASAAGVDVALISRYFGSKLGLFKATLEGAFEWDEMTVVAQDDLVEGFLNLFVHAPRGGEEPSVIHMLLTNAHDQDVAEVVCSAFQGEFYDQIVAVTHSKERAAMFVSVLLGISVAEKTLHLPGIAEPTSKKYRTQLRHMMRAALNLPHNDKA